MWTRLWKTPSSESPSGSIAAAYALKWIGILITGVGVAGGLAVAFEDNFSNRDGWIRRTQTLRRLQAIRDDYEFQKAKGESDDSLAEMIHTRHQAARNLDLDLWAETMRAP